MKLSIFPDLSVSICHLRRINEKKNELNKAVEEQVANLYELEWKIYNIEADASATLVGDNNKDTCRKSSKALAKRNRK